MIHKRGEWLPVTPSSPYSSAPNQFNEVHFNPVGTKKIRLEIELPANKGGGLFEWQLM